MSRIAAILALIVLFAGFIAASAQSAEGNEKKAIESSPGHDWLGVGPIYSYDGLISPYYPYYYPTYSYFLPGSQPAYYNPTYLVARFPAYPWWIGEHGGLGKTMQIARSGSSMRVYSGGVWQTL